MLKSFLHSPYIKLFVFLAMVLMSAIELMEGVTEFRSAHGVLLFAVFNTLKAISSLYHAAEVIED